MKFKRFTAFAVALLILLSGCSNSADSTKAEKNSSETSATTGADSSVNEAFPENINSAKLFTEIDDGPSEFDGIDFEIYDVSAVCDGKSVYSSCIGNDGKIQLALVDFVSGEITSGAYAPTFEDEETSFRFYACKNGVVYADLASGKIAVFDLDLNFITEVTPDLNSDYPECFVTDNSVILRSYDAGNVVKISFDEKMTPKTEEFTFDCVDIERLVTTSVVSETELLVEIQNEDFTQKSYHIVDFKNNTSTLLNVGENCTVAPIKDGFAVVNNNINEMTLYHNDSPDIRQSFSFKVGSYYLQTKDNCAYFTSDYCYTSTDSSEKNHLTLIGYSTDNGRCVGELDIAVDNYGYFNHVAPIDEKLLVFMSVDEKFRTYLWTPEAPSQLEASYGGLADENISAKNTEMISQIKENYNIDVFTKNEAVRSFNGYAVVPENSDVMINNALTELESFLSKLPDGMVDEMLERGKYDGFEIYLTGRIVPDTSTGYSINDANGFAQTDDNRHNIVVDITMDDLDQTFAHEFMHALENTMYAIASNEEYSVEYELFGRWSFLNPKDFDYTYAYTDDNGNTLLGEKYAQYLGSGYFEGDDVNNVYFVDGYATNYPTEDLARIFENICTFSADKLPDFFKSEKLQLKTAYLCCCIREVFECISDDSAPFWEQSVNPEYDMKYFDKLLKNSHQGVYQGVPQ